MRSLDLNAIIGTKAKQLSVSIQQSKISIKWKNSSQEALLEGDLCAKVKVEESTWLIDNGQLHVQLEVDFPLFPPLNVISFRNSTSRNGGKMLLRITLLLIRP